MKIWLTCASTFFLFLSLSFPALAHLTNDNPRASIAFLASHVITGPPGSIGSGLFKVRVIDAHGAPIAGLKVWFYNNQVVGIPESSPPPFVGYGSFQGPENPLGVISDANGVATSPPYRFGSSGHDVVAGVYGIAGPENAVVGYPPLVAMFHVNHVPPEPPPSLPPPQPEVVPVPQGASGAVALPLLSGPVLALLTMVVAILALFNIRKSRPARRSRS